MKTLWQSVVMMPLQRTLSDVPWFGPVISAVLIALLVNILSEALTTWGGLGLGWGFVLALAVCAFAFVALYNRQELIRRSCGPGYIADRPKPAQFQGLIFLYSRAETLCEAVAHHHPVLKQVWILTTPEKVNEVSALIGDLTRQFNGLQIMPYPINDHYATDECYQAARSIFQNRAPAMGIQPEHVIADITGGTKPMTAGVLMACLEGEHAVEHVPTRFGDDDQPTGPLPPIEIVLSQSRR